MKGYRLSQVKKRDDQRGLDSYLTRVPPKDWSLCLKCQAIYHNKHWHLDPVKAKELLKKKAPPVVCPACQKIHDHFSLGIVTLRGTYLQKHRDEVINLVRNEEGRARGFNPLERIISLEEGNGSIKIETTTEKLAQRIGKRVFHSHHGRVEYKWSRDNRFMRVEWERSLVTEK